MKFNFNIRAGLLGATAVTGGLYCASNALVLGFGLIGHVSENTSLPMAVIYSLPNILLSAASLTLSFTTLFGVIALKKGMPPILSYMGGGAAALAALGFSAKMDGGDMIFENLAKVTPGLGQYLFY